MEYAGLVWVSWVLSVRFCLTYRGGGQAMAEKAGSHTGKHPADQCGTQEASNSTGGLWSTG